MSYISGEILNTKVFSAHVLILGKHFLTPSSTIQLSGFILPSERGDRQKKNVEKGLFPVKLTGPKTCSALTKFFYKLSLTHADVINPSVYKQCLIPVNSLKKEKLSLSCYNWSTN